MQVMSFSSLHVSVQRSSHWLFDISAYDRGAMIAAAALPVAGNVYILAQHYGVAPQRASAAILVSTMLSIVTVPLVIGWVSV